jgi:thymidine kinase
MAKLFFNFAAMSAGKSTLCLQAHHDWTSKGHKALLYTAEIDDRFGVGRVTSRLGISHQAHTFNAGTNFLELELAGLSCILIDESQFLSPDQVKQLHQIVAVSDIPVMCYGLRSDFKGDPFPGSAALMALAEDIQELKTLCQCRRKATFNARIGPDGHCVKEGPTLLIGGDDRYRALCATCYYTDAPIKPFEALGLTNAG